ncbi:MAG: exodeoxyribonuclease III [bacterium]|nr:exodeoxyribonuclease III [bacterium]
MRLVSWNVNGLRACVRKGFAQWLESSGAAVVGVQEVRARPEQLPADIRRRDGWHVDVAAAERPGYSGVALISRRSPDAVSSSLGEPRFDVEGRLQLARFGSLLLVNSYFPNGNGQNRDLSRIPYKLDYYRKLFAFLEPAKASGEPILVIGDFNTAHQEIDLARPRQNRETSGFRPEERDELDRWIRAGWVDTFREYESDGGHYTWWSQRKGVRERNIGWRLDYVMASPGAMPFLRGATIHPEVMGSDHCPISVEVDDAIVGA